MIDSVAFDGYNIQEELGFWLKWRIISAPQVKASYEEVPGANGSLDTTEANGDVFYENRTIQMGCIHPNNEYQSDFDELLAKFHGKQCQIVFTNDPDYYWSGRVFVEEYDSRTHELAMYATVYPYKFEIDETVESVSVNGEETVTLSNSRMKVMPTVTTDAEVTLEWGSHTKTISAGTFLIAGLELSEGELEIALSGTANVSFTYRKGTL